LWLRRDVKHACGLRVRPSFEKAVQVEAGISELDKAYFRVHLNTKKVAEITDSFGKGSIGDKVGGWRYQTPAWGRRDPFAPMGWTNPYQQIHTRYG